MGAEQTALAATMKSLGAELAAGRSGVVTPATPSSPRRRDAAVALGVEAQHALLHASSKLTAESLVNGGVQPAKGEHENCGVCTVAKMRAPAVRAGGGPRPAPESEAHVCGKIGGSGNAAGLSGAVSSQLASEAM